MLFETLNLKILNILGKATLRIGEKARSLVTFMCCIIISSIFSLDPQNALDNRRMAIVSLIVLVAIAVSAKGEIKPVRWNKLPVLTIELFAMAMLAVRPIHPIGEGYIIFAVDILILFPMLYTVMAESGRGAHFIGLMTYAIITMGIICFAMSLFLALGDGNYVLDGRVMGVVRNPNYYGTIGLALSIASIYNIIKKHTHYAWKMLSAISAGVGTSMILASVSRTALLSLIECFFVFFIFSLKNLKGHANHDEGASFRRRTHQLLYPVLVILMIVSVLSAFRLQQMVFFGENNDDMGNTFVQNVSIIPEVYADDEEVNGTEGEKPEEQNTVSGRLFSNTDLDSFSSGRINLWKLYSNYFNINGNDYDTIKHQDQFYWLIETRAHNNIIDYIFRFGIPAGMLYSIFFIYILFKAMIMTFSQRYNTPEEMWVVMMVVIYAVYSMIEIASLPFTRYTPCLFFLSAASIVCSPSEF